jgi:succinate dehydrogenase / fumarate reductase flavoprotein subunit
MGGLWVDYNLMSNLPGLFVIGEANFSDHGANRLGASALMQGLADGYFILPYTIGQFFASTKQVRVSTDHEEFRRCEADVVERTRKLLAIKGRKTATEFHREVGKVLWEHAGMSRTDASLREALRKIPELREEFWKNVNVPGSDGDLNQALERAGRVADYLEFGELLVRDALTRDESCGAHFREEHQHEDGEAKRNDKEFMHVAAWEYAGPDKEPVRNVEPLMYEEIKPTVRSYK